MIALRETPLSDVQPGDILLRKDDDSDRAVLIGEFVARLNPRMIQVYNPADGWHTVVYDLPDTVLVLTTDAGRAALDAGTGEES